MLVVNFGWLFNNLKCFTLLDSVDHRKTGRIQMRLQVDFLTIIKMDHLESLLCMDVDCYFDSLHQLLVTILPIHYYFSTWNRVRKHNVRKVQLSSWKRKSFPFLSVLLLCKGMWISLDNRLWSEAICRLYHQPIRSLEVKKSHKNIYVFFKCTK